MKSKAFLVIFLIILLSACGGTPEPTATPVPSPDPIQGIYPIAENESYYIHLGAAQSGSGSDSRVEFWIFRQDEVDQFQSITVNGIQIYSIRDFREEINAHPDWYIRFKDLDGDGETDDLKVLLKNQDGIWEYGAYLWNREAEQFQLDESIKLDTETHKEN